MDERNISHGEFAVMSLRNGASVAAMGTNSIGANGDSILLPLPGGINILFTSFEVFTP